MTRAFRLPRVPALLLPVAFLALAIFLAHDASPTASAQAGYREITLDVDPISLNERDGHTIITITATMPWAATQGTNVALSLQSSPLLTPGVRGASSSDYYSELEGTHRILKIGIGQTTGSTTIAITPTYDTTIEGDEAIVITGSVDRSLVGDHTVAPTEVILEDGPYLSFPKYIYGQLHYPGEAISVTVEEAVNQPAQGTVTYALTKTEPAANPLGLTFDPATRQLTGTAPAEAAVPTEGITARYTITARDSVGHRATTIISVAVVKNVCSATNTTLFPNGTHPSGQMAPPGELVRDCNVLLAAKDPLRGTGTLNWATDTDITTWDGLSYTSDTKNIRKIEVRGMSLNGVIPPVLGHLATPHSTDLVLGDDYRAAPVAKQNRLTGPIPPELGIPPNLIVLALSRNSLTGPIPRELANTGKLFHLYLHDTDIVAGTEGVSGPIPPEFANGLLRNFNISGNANVTGHIPWQLGKLVSSGSYPGLQVLNLSSNDLEGTIPWQLGRFGKNQQLALSHNRLTGRIPWQLGKLGREEASVGNRITYVYLNGNQLTGPIPPQLGNIPNLRTLSLSQNRLTGHIPRELGNLSPTKFTQLFLRDNELSGPIPPELAKLKGLQILYLHNNDLSGEIPTQLGSLTALTALWLANNHLSGAIPSELGSLSALRQLILNENQLSSLIPSELGNLANLQYLYLSCNDLTGYVPGSIGAITSLLELTIYGNPRLALNSISDRDGLTVFREGTCVRRDGPPPRRDSPPPPTATPTTGGTPGGPTTGGTTGTGGGGGGGFAPVAVPEFSEAPRAARTAPEGAPPGYLVGDPVSAVHPGGEAITYVLRDPDAGPFAVDPDTGQLTVKEGAELSEGDTFTITMIARAASGALAFIDVTVTVTGRACHPYDFNCNGVIELEEALAAVRDYFDGKLTLEEVLDVVRLYFNS